MFQKVLILNFPKISLDAPPLAPALLGAICRELDVHYDFVDCNLDFYQHVPQHLDQEILTNYAERHSKALSAEAQTWLDKYFQTLADRCKLYDLIAISVFSMHSVALTKYFLQGFRKQITAKIVVGGAGLNDTAWADSTQGIVFYQYLSQKKLVDYFVLGEGEQAFRQLLGGNVTHDSLNNDCYNFLDDFSTVPVPEFDRYHLDRYQKIFNGKRILSIEGSRGCVKNCTFCDIKKIWGHYKFKNGADLADELVLLHDRYQVDHFWFNDSLINGSLKVFRQFCEALADRRRDKTFTWSAQAIIRSQTPRDELDFELLKASGCETLAVGLEHFSESVRYHMTKKFNNSDVDNFFRLAQKYDIKLFLLMLVGYPTETQQDFEINLAKLEQYQHLADDGTISAINFGSTMTILPDTPLNTQRKGLGMVYPIRAQKHPTLWSVGANTPEQRIAWRVQLEEKARTLGYNCIENQYDVEQTMLAFLRNYRQHQ